MLSRMAKRFLTLIVLVLIGSPAWAQAIDYTLSFPAPEHRWMQVEVRFPNVPAGTLQVRMARTSPGRYALHEFAKNVFDVSAVNGKGQPIAATRPDPHQWDFANHDGTVAITYKIFGDRTDGTYLGINDVHAHINIPAADVRPRLVRAAGAGQVRAAAREEVEGGDATVPNAGSAGVHGAEHSLPDGQHHGLQQLHAA